MKVIIAGSRDIVSYKDVCSAIESSGFEITEVVSGTARGVDVLGERWAKDNNVPIKRFFPDWGKYGKRAGPLRNAEMARYVCEACGSSGGLIAVWDGKSSGTKGMIDIAKSNGLSVYVYISKKIDINDCD